ncbi:hypothetical protein D3C81_1089860 [compost metagenome]
MVEADAEQAGENHRRLLTRRLPTDEETLAAWCGDLCQIDRYAAQFYASGKALQQPTEQYEQRCGDAEGGVARHAGNQHRTGSHQRQRDDQPLATAMTVNVGAEENRPERTHQEAGPKSGQ